ncbi:MBL fold metallo-hydrolase [Amycolatopsis pithecellobii]|uniref:Zn-dependent hydrolase n=1 Tax=Amycolatopsis pithecellobii TaxID=664692 RepID=A0A6N7ZD22_9PSEU|nr:MBL fold metallo-hydrolase [Amycolatopsis pithecellobii]MTD59595.1 Zn-dependent hydrolase [Amycolatopsis pithecellobii]
MYTVRDILGWAARTLVPSFGGKPDRELMARSPQFHNGRFYNTNPSAQPDLRTLLTAMREMFFGDRWFRAPIPLVPQRPDHPDEGLHITWYGHASALIEIDGRRVLIDPVWSDRVAPTRFTGPRRLHPPPHRLEDLPELDQIIISHDHYDHLDYDTVRALTRTQRAPFVVPLGVGAHLRRWRVPHERIIELDWDESIEIAGISTTAAEAQHFSGRELTRDNTLWASWIITTAQHRVFYTADTGYFDGFARIGEKHGPFDVTLVQIGAYDKAWPGIHMTPEEGVAAHREARGGLLIPLHWATFRLAPHPWSEPAERVWAEAKAHEVPLAIPRPGERVDVAKPPAVNPWW